LDPDENLPLDEYLVKISNPGQDVGEFVLRALSNVLQKSIKVYFAECAPRTYSPSDSSISATTDYINIIYKGSSESNRGHYMALIKNVFGSSEEGN